MVGQALVAIRMNTLTVVVSPTFALMMNERNEFTLIRNVPFVLWWLPSSLLSMVLKKGLRTTLMGGKKKNLVKMLIAVLTVFEWEFLKWWATYVGRKQLVMSIVMATVSYS